MLSVFLGARFPKWAANLPLVSELFDFDILARGLREEQKLERIKNSNLVGITKILPSILKNSSHMLTRCTKRKISRFCTGILCDASAIHF